MTLKGQIALVTGASRGIGQAIALELGRQGAQVIGTATSSDGAEKISQALKQNNVAGRGIVLDVNSTGSIAAAVSEL
jgi:3-oxoacyl-[acyl-carrier protein] reductase